MIRNPKESVSPDAWRAIHIVFIFVLAFAIRLIYINQLSHTYFFAPFKGGYDDYIFDTWAGEILKGNWFGDGQLYIYRMPLYVYFLSLIYYILGHNYWAVYIIQSAIGALACVLVYIMAGMVFDRRVGLVAGIMNALYGVFLYYNGMLLGETIGLFAGCLAFMLLVLFQKREKAPYLFLSGIFVGISMLVRGNMMIVLPFIFLWVFIVSKRHTPFRVFYRILALLAGVAIAVSPIIIRNYIHDHDFVPVTALGGVNVYIGNAYGADGKYRIVEKVSTNAEKMVSSSIEAAERDLGRSLKPSEVSNYWVRETLKSIKAHGARYLFGLTVKKIILFWNSYELPDIWDYYFFRRYIPLLRMPLFGFWLIAPLALLGMYLSRKEKGPASLLYVFIFGYMVSLVAVFISSRYRMGVVPFLSVFAAYPIAKAPVLFKDKDLKNSAAAACAILILGVLFCNIKIDRVSFETSHNSLGILLKRSGKIEEAIKEYNRAINIKPAYPTPYYNLGLLYRETGRRDLAITYFKKALELNPYFKTAREKLDEMGAK